MQIIEPRTPEDFSKYYQLRYNTLRRPWNQPEGSERAEDDATATHAMLLNDAGEAIGVCRMHLHTPQEGQIRFMGMREDQQGKGLGKLLLDYLEEQARTMGATTMTLQAREKAVNFYRRNGYEIIEKTHLLFGSIQHYKMTKQL
jgi:N-acetylglutamate synthase-like GNAT family acetyltransferase